MVRKLHLSAPAHEPFQACYTAVFGSLQARIPAETQQAIEPLTDTSPVGRSAVARSEETESSAKAVNGKLNGASCLQGTTRTKRSAKIASTPDAKIGRSEWLLNWCYHNSSASGLGPKKAARKR